MKNRLIRFAATTSVAVLLVLGGTGGAYAQDTAWNTGTSGSWTNAANWNNGIPNGNAAILTNASASYTVTYDGGAGNSITNLVVNNASVANTTTIDVNSGVMNFPYPGGAFQGVGGVQMTSNAVMNLVGATVDNTTLFSLSGGSVINIGGNNGGCGSPGTLTYDNFESYTNGEVLATSETPAVTGSPWGVFGAATAEDPTAFTGIGVGGSVGAEYAVDWSAGNNGDLVFWFPTPTNLVCTPGITIALAVSNVTGLVSNTAVLVAEEQADGAIYQINDSAAQVLTNGAYQTFTFFIQQSDTTLVNGSGVFDLTQVQDLRIRFENAGGVGTELALVDNFQGFSSNTPAASIWNQTSGFVAIGEVGNGTVVINPGGTLTGSANQPAIGRNDTLSIPDNVAASNTVGHVYVEGGSFIWPGIAGSANPMSIGRGQIGIVTVSNGCFALTSVQATNGLRVGYTSSTSAAAGHGTVEVFGGVVTNTGSIAVGAGQGTASTFGVGSITVSGGTFYQLGMATTGTTAFVRIANASYDSGFLTVNGSGTYITTNTVLVGNNALSSGLILVSGNGQLIATNIAVNPGLIVLGGAGGNGTLTLSGGTTIVDRLLATNVTSTINFSSGQLDVNVQLIVSNGVALVVGDGTHAATLAIEGGTHWFGNGLNVSGNGVLTGVGTINAAVTLANSATWAPGVSGGGTQTVVGAVVLNPTTTLDYQYGAPGGSADLVSITGNLTLDGTLNVTNLGGFTNGTYTVFTYTGTLVNNTLTVGTLPGGLSGTISNDTVNKLVLLVVSTGGSNPFTTWQDQYFTVAELGTPSFSGPNADPLGKGMSNTNQFLAGFNPTNSAAYLHILSVAKTNSNVDIKVTYLGANGDSTYSGGPASRTNVLEFTTGTANGGYTNSFTSTGQTNILSGGTGLGVMASMVDSGGATNKPSRFYRVRVLLP
jgi:fibronectin-binding autotransporter adhesin